MARTNFNLIIHATDSVPRCKIYILHLGTSVSLGMAKARLVYTCDCRVHVDSGASSKT